AKHPNHCSAGQTGRGAISVGIRQGPPGRETCVTNGNTIAGIARGRDIGSIVEIEWVQLILLPHLPVGRQKVTDSVGPSVRREGRFANVVVATNRSIPTVGSEFDRTAQPKLVELSGA